MPCDLRHRSCQYPLRQRASITGYQVDAPASGMLSVNAHAHQQDLLVPRPLTPLSPQLVSLHWSFLLPSRHSSPPCQVVLGVGSVITLTGGRRTQVTAGPASTGDDADCAASAGSPTTARPSPAVDLGTPASAAASAGDVEDGTALAPATRFAGHDASDPAVQPVDTTAAWGRTRHPSFTSSARR